MRRLWLLLLLLATPAGADRETADFFVGKARAALDDDDRAEAGKWVARALEEEPRYAPVLLVAAEFARRQGANADAVKHLEACVALEDVAGLSSRETTAIAKAKEMLAALDPARFAYEKIVDDYVARVKSIVERHAKDEALVKECWRHVLLVRPDDQTARRGASGVGIADGGGDGVVLFNGKSLEGWTGGPPEWSVRDGLMVGSVSDSAVVSRCLREVAGDYTLTVELRVVRNHGRDPLCGVLLGVRGSYDHFGLWIWPDSWRFEHQTGEHERDELHRKPFRNFEGGEFKLSKFNTYKVEVHGKRVTGFVNGTKIWSTSGATRPLDGFVGLWVQEQEVEIRRVVLEEKK
jgi:hypothetical protein